MRQEMRYARLISEIQGATKQAQEIQSEACSGVFEVRERSQFADHCAVGFFGIAVVNGGDEYLWHKGL